jgi:ADP-ribose pyrophosphatase
VTSDDCFVVARQYRHGIERVSLMLPGGLLEEGESPLLAAKRELAEETGYVSDSWESLGSFVPNSNYRCGEAHLFLARDAHKVAEPDDGDLEETELIVIPRAILLEEIQKGNVVSISSAAAIALASMRLES